MRRRMEGFYLDRRPIQRGSEAVSASPTELGRRPVTRARMIAAALLALASPMPAAPAVQERLFVALSRAEGCVRWNNPGCLKFAGQAAAVRGPHGYAVFKTAAAGRQALLLRIEHGVGLSVREFLQRYNPGVPGYPAWVAAVGHLALDQVL